MARVIALTWPPEHFRLEISQTGFGKGSSEMASIPKAHVGINYTEVMADISKKRSTKKYLEIGVCHGHLFSKIYAHHAIGVDPAFQINANVADRKTNVTLHSMTSDAFFADKKLAVGHVDLAFLDGLHTFEFLLRDFYNTEATCSRTSLIGMHDCLPLNAAMMSRDQLQANSKSVGTDFVNWYTGDVWKIILILKKYRPDLRIVCVDCAPTGVVFVSNLDPASQVLASNYFAILDEFLSLGNGDSELQSLYEGIDIVPSESVIKEYDHSVFFRL